MTLQVVVDTNLVVSAFLWGGTPETLISELLTRGIPMLTTPAMIDELDATLRKPKFDSRFQAKGVTPDALMDEYRQMTQLVIPAEIPDDCVRDPKDRSFWQQLVAARHTSSAAIKICPRCSSTTR